jgi:cyclic pyranopterin phosphate synthase
MFDPFHRPVKSLRISLTRKCNLKCLYCHEEGELRSAQPYEISVAEIAKIARICHNEGVTKVKFSGGEPLLRKDLSFGRYFNDDERSTPRGADRRSKRT